MNYAENRFEHGLPHLGEYSSPPVLEYEAAIETWREQRMCIHSHALDPRTFPTSKTIGFNMKTDFRLNSMFAVPMFSLQHKTRANLKTSEVAMK